MTIYSINFIECHKVGIDKSSLYGCSHYYIGCVLILTFEFLISYGNLLD